MSSRRGEKSASKPKSPRGKTSGKSAPPTGSASVPPSVESDAAERGPWTPLVGHEEPIDRLRRALTRGRLGHAFLFVGPEGIGKRRAAEHVAQALLCEDKGDDPLTPCGQCAACRQVEQGAHPDFVSAAKPRDKNELPIELVQDLCARLTLKPARGDFKIVLLDDADALNEESANAFLKTLEEPSPGSLLILIATDVETQLATIVSRCQVVRFPELTESQAALILIRLGVCSSEEQGKRLARLAGGSIRRALDLSQPEWSAARTQLLDGLIDLSRAPADAASRLAEQIQSFVEEAGKESAPRRARARELIKQVARLFRDATCAKLGGGVSSDHPDAARIRLLAERHDPDCLTDVVDRCLDADYHIGRFLNQSLALACWVDDLAQLMTGQDVPPVGATY